jgi:hypothetical protein
VGVDLYQRMSQIAVLTADGELTQHRLPNDLAHLEPFFAQLPTPSPIAIEVSGTLGWLVDLLERLAHQPVLSHPKETKAIASARLKNDQVDAQRLALLLRGDLLPPVWITPAAMREARELVRHRGRPDLAPHSGPESHARDAGASEPSAHPGEAPGGPSEANENCRRWRSPRRQPVPSTYCVCLVNIERSAGLIDDGRHAHPDPHRPLPRGQKPPRPGAREPRAALSAGRPPTHRTAPTSPAIRPALLGPALPHVARLVGGGRHRPSRDGDPETADRLPALLGLEEPPARAGPSGRRAGGPPAHPTYVARQPLWGAPRIHGKLQKLGIEISQAAVSKYLDRRSTPPLQTWRKFLDKPSDPRLRGLLRRPHRDVQGLVCLRSWRTSAGASFTSTSPTPPRPSGRPRNSWRPAPGRPPAIRAARSRCSLRVAFSSRVQTMGIHEVKTAPRSPWQNPSVERLIGTLRRECLDHVVVLNEPHLRRFLREYLIYYHGPAHTSPCEGRPGATTGGAS